MPILAPPATTTDVERLTLNGLSLSSGGLYLSALTALPPKARTDWISGADSENAALSRLPLHENRTVTCALAMDPQLTMDAALDLIGQVVDKVRSAPATPDGIPLVWSPSGSIRAVTFDVLLGEIIDLPIGWESGWLAQAPSFTLELTCKPYWRGTETLTATTTASTPLVTMEIANASGDISALGRLIVTDMASNARRHVEWGLEGPDTYNSATSLLLDSDSLVTSGFAGTQGTLSGTYDPDATGNNAITAGVYSAPIALCGTGDLTHVGTFRVKARLWSGAAAVEARLAWQAGDGPMSVGDWNTVTGAVDWVDVDLGSIDVPAVLSGTQRWTGRLELRNTDPATQGTVVLLDYLTLMPTAAGYGKARATSTSLSGVLSATDAFLATTAGAALNGRVAPLGGTWATSGDATDFVFSDVGVFEQIARSTTSSTSGRTALLGTSTFTNVQTSMRFSLTDQPVGGNVVQSVVVRWVDSSNYLRADVIAVPGGYGFGSLQLVQVIAGTATTASDVKRFTVPRGSQFVYRLTVLAYASGRVIVTFATDAGVTISTIDATVTAAATAGALASGRSGLRDFSAATVANTRYYDDVSIQIPPVEPVVVNSGKTIQFRYDDVIRDDSTGAFVGRPPSYRGSRFLVPVGTSRVAVKARRYDADVQRDFAMNDSTKIQVGITPRGLVVPR